MSEMEQRAVELMRQTPIDSDQKTPPSERRLSKTLEDSRRLVFRDVDVTVHFLSEVREIRDIRVAYLTGCIYHMHAYIVPLTFGFVLAARKPNEQDVWQAGQCPTLCGRGSKLIRTNAVFGPCAISRLTCFHRSLS